MKKKKTSKDKNKISPQAENNPVDNEIAEIYELQINEHSTNITQVIERIGIIDGVIFAYAKATKDKEAYTIQGEEVNQGWFYKNLTEKQKSQLKAARVI